MNTQTASIHQAETQDNSPSAALALAQASELIGSYETAIRYYREYLIKRPGFAYLTTNSISRCEQKAKAKKKVPNATPALSIIIPCHNSENHIEECLSSVLAQSATNIEVILINDGSTDRTLEILNKFKDNDARIKLLTNKKPSGSAGVPRNQGIVISQGRYIGFVDSDDRISPEYFEKMLIELVSQDADLAINSGFINTHANKGDEPRRYKEVDMIKYDSNTLSCNHSSSMIWDKIYARDLLLDNNILLGTYPAAVDVPFVFKAYYYCRKPIQIFNDGYFYRREAAGSVTVRYRKSSNCDFELRAFDDSFAWARSSKVDIAYTAYMQIKQLTSYIYTCKLIPLSHLQEYFHQCSSRIQKYPPGFADILHVARRDYLIDAFDIFRLNKIQLFIKEHRRRDSEVLLAISNKNEIPKSIHIALEESNQRIVFFPDWSKSNPYQRLLYQAISENLKTDCFGLDPADVCEENILGLLGKKKGFIHIHWLHPFLDPLVFESFRYILIRAKNKGVKILWTIHNIFSHESKDTQRELDQRRQIFELSDHVFCHSLSAIRMAKNIYKVSAYKLSIIQHGAYPLSSLMQGPNRHARTTSNIRLLMLGDLRPYKNTEKAISILEKVNKQLPRDYQIELIIAGKPISQEQSILLKGLEAKHNWLFLNLNRLPEENLAVYIGETDFVFLPYTRLQTSGLALLGLSHGKPFIGPEMGDLVEIGNSYCKILYTSEDDLAAKLMEVSKQSRTGNLEKMHPTERILDYARSISWQHTICNSNLGSILSSS